MLFLEHFFIDCSKLNGFWRTVFSTINTFTNYKFQENWEVILFGIDQDDKIKASTTDLKIANTIILIGKMCISKMRYGLIKDINLIFEIEWDLRKNSILNTE